MFKNRFRTTFSVTPTPRKNAYKPSLYDICLEYGIKDVKFIFILFFETSKQIKKISRQNLRLPVRVQTACKGNIKIILHLII